MNLIKINAYKFIETQQKSKESAPLIQKKENGINNEVRDQEIAPMQLVPVRREIFSKLYVNRVEPLPIIPGNKHISPDMSMSPRCHEAVPVPEMASTPLVEASPQIFRRVFPREIQADRETLLMSILTTELLQKLGTYCPLRVPFRLKNASYCFSMLMDELPQGHEKFDLSYFDNVVVFSEGWDFLIDHMDGILELNTHLAVRPAEFELAQDGVEYCSHVVGLGKQSPAQLKVRAIIDFSISRYKTQVKVWGYDRQYIPMFFRSVTPVTETLKRKSKKGDIKWTFECPEFFRQLEGNLSTNSVLYAPDFTK
ncbi:retrovirus-related Pol polyprotein from transposon 17.6 [Trichonephila clavipes]|nr:retrovirus-related Pol polyprotein from transposon 17.6 [Trichonephila clavipes]